MLCDMDRDAKNMLLINTKVRIITSDEGTELRNL